MTDLLLWGASPQLSPPAATSVTRTVTTERHPDLEDPMTVTVTSPVTPTATEFDDLPTVDDVIAAVRTGRIEPTDAHPTMSPWTPVVHWTAALTGAASLATVLAYWQGHDTAGAWALIAAFTLAAVTLLARAGEWSTTPAANNA